jgi:hypothetical protein
MPMRHLASLGLSLGLFMAVGGSLHATTVEPPAFDELVNRSDAVVRARVVHVETELRRRGEHDLVYTLVTLEVGEVIAGEAPRRLVLSMLGGEHEGLMMRVAGVPRFRVGEEDILFIQGNGTHYHPLYAAMYGRYPVRRDKGSGREYVTRNNGVPLGDVSEVALPLAEGPGAVLQRRLRSPQDALTPAEFIQHIRVTRDDTARDDRAR